ncbi:hypothetical protein KKE54_06825 [bacterium]|nr:hypothetical protein [bacterium]
MNKKIPVFLLLIALPLFAFFNDDDDKPDQTLQVPKEQRHVKVSVVSPQSSEAVIGLNTRGVVEPAVALSINAQSDGIFHSKTAVSSYVNKGDKIGVLTDPARTMQLSALRTKIALLKEQVGIERQKGKRNKEMLDLGIISELDILVQESAIREKELVLEQSENDVARLLLLQKGQNIYAPTSGYVRSISADGSYIGYGAQVAAVTSSAVIIRLFVNPAYAKSLHIRQAVNVMAPTGEINATIAAILPQSNSNLIDVIAKPSQTLPVGLQIEATIQTGSLQGWIIPKASIILEQNRPAVFVIKDNVAHIHFVDVQKDMIDKVLVNDHLNADDKIAYKNAYMLNDGAAVEVLP